MAAQRKKHLSRTEKNNALLAQAAVVKVPSVADVVVAGGGASGLTAAISAAEALQDAGHPGTVVVFERALECGRTILATGGGRCNFANEDMRPENYRHPAFVRSVVGGKYLKEVLSFFRTCGLAWITEDEGRMYPVTRKASSVRDVLLARAREIVDIQTRSQGFEVAWKETFEEEERHTLTARTVILAGGGASTSAVTHNLDLFMVSERPGLCALACLPKIPAQLDGKRAHVRAHLMRDGKLQATECGEVLFRSFGISGIMVFNLSRMAHSGDTISLDLLYEVDRSALQAAIEAQTTDGILDSALAEFVAPGTSMPAKISAAQHLVLTVTGVAQSVPPQITIGGLAIENFDQNLEAHAYPGLFACGEALDIDAPCGGFNLAWAWKSGMVAGISAAQHLI